MRKFLLLIGILVSICLSSCTSPLFDKTAEAYEESAKKIAMASSDNECQSIHDELMSKLFNLTREYPDWQKIVTEESQDSKALQKVRDSYDRWNKVVKETVKDNNYVYMSLCTFQNAIEQSEGKTPDGQDMKLPKSISETDGFPLPSANSEIVNDLLENYEDMARQHQVDVALTNPDEYGYTYLDDCIATAQKSKKKVQALAYNCFSIAKVFDAKQEAKYLKINNELRTIK